MTRTYNEKKSIMRGRLLQIFLAADRTDFERVPELR